MDTVKAASLWWPSCQCSEARLLITGSADQRD